MRIIYDGLWCLLAWAFIYALPAHAAGLDKRPSFPAVTSFGVPEDSTFVFCEREDCPKRSLKHLAISPPLNVQRQVGDEGAANP